MNNGENIKKYNELFLKYLNDLVNDIESTSDFNMKMFENIANRLSTELKNFDINIAEDGIKTLMMNAFKEYSNILKKHFDNSGIHRISANEDDNKLISEMNEVTSNLANAVANMNKIQEYKDLLDKVKSGLISYFKQVHPNYDSIENDVLKLLDTIIVEDVNAYTAKKIDEFSSFTLPELYILSDSIKREITEDISAINEENERIEAEDVIAERDAFISETMDIDIKEGFENGMVTLTIIDSMGVENKYFGEEAIEKLTSYNQLFESSRPGKVVDTSKWAHSLPGTPNMSTGPIINDDLLSFDPNENTSNVVAEFNNEININLTNSDDNNLDNTPDNNNNLDMSFDANLTVSNTDTSQNDMPDLSFETKKSLDVQPITTGDNNSNNDELMGQFNVMDISNKDKKKKTNKRKKDENDSFDKFNNSNSIDNPNPINDLPTNGMMETKVEPSTTNSSLLVDSNASINIDENNNNNNNTSSNEADSSFVTTNENEEFIRKFLSNYDNVNDANDEIKIEEEIIPDDGSINTNTPTQEEFNNLVEEAPSNPELTALINPDLPKENIDISLNNDVLSSDIVNFEDNSTGKEDVSIDDGLSEVRSYMKISNNIGNTSSEFSFLPDFDENHNLERDEFIKKTTGILIEEDIDNKGSLYLKVTEPTGREVIYTGKEAISMIKNYNKTFLEAYPDKSVDTSLLDKFEKENKDN